MKLKMIAAMCCMLALCALTSCQLAQENAGENAYTDKLVGVFVTTEHLNLFDMESYLNDNINSFRGGNITVDGDTQKYKSRIYAELTKKTLTNEETGEKSDFEDYVFPIDGIPYFTATVPATEGRDGYNTTISDPAISEGHMDSNFGDDVNSTNLEATIYVSPTGNDCTFFFNPVYQSVDGKVYLTAGTGMSMQSAESEGTSMSQTMDATTTVTENGKSKSESISIKLSVSVMFAPEKTVILQMDKDSKLLSRTEYEPDSLPDNIAPEPSAAYIVVETHKQNAINEATVSRDIYGKDAENIESFYVRDDGICVKCWTQVEWPSIGGVAQL